MPEKGDKQNTIHIIQEMHNLIGILKQILLTVYIFIRCDWVEENYLSAIGLLLLLNFLCVWIKVYAKFGCVYVYIFIKFGYFPFLLK